ncbi:MAG: hypothetical protein A3J74_05430 [Elusimicrobia bacterium RIFCSPHIGHO2_02_FULL_57_9]|nr:MAG: hypothetical protein A3J74_05430 [Elusimicrobia bacterium RIFCSPHIGHO2_02_FULL_57_9]
MPALAGPAAARPNEPSPEKLEYERKFAEIEKRLADEHEKLLLANLKSQEESATAARVEVSIKELQEKLRRDRREQEQEEARHKLEAKLQEMEERLAQERETWVATLRNQMQVRESQEKEVENHLALRIQEMERRWLDEKAQWQKIAFGKDEEIRNLRSLAEKLRSADLELSKTSADKNRLKEDAENAKYELQKLKAVAATLERQLSAARAQAGEFQTAKACWEQTREKYKAEFSVLQRKWLERERELRAEAVLQLSKMLDTERDKLKALSQEEINQRVSKIAEQMQREREAERIQMEGDFRVQLERELASRAEKLQSDWDNAREELEREIDRLHKEMLKRDADWSRRMASPERPQPPSVGV